MLLLGKSICSRMFRFGSVSDGFSQRDGRKTSSESLFEDRELPPGPLTETEFIATTRVPGKVCHCQLEQLQDSGGFRQQVPILGHACWKAGGSTPAFPPPFSATERRLY